MPQFTNKAFPDKAFTNKRSRDSDRGRRTQEGPDHALPWGSAPYLTYLFATQANLSLVFPEHPLPP